MNEHHFILLILAVLIVSSIALAYCTPVDVSTEARGIVRTNGVVRVAAEVTGKLVNVYMHQGQPVHAGDALVQLDTHQVDQELHLLHNRIHLIESRLKNEADERSRTRLRTLYRQLELAELARGQLTIMSPAEGQLEAVHIFRVGEPIHGGTEIATIIPSDRDLTVEARITQSVLRLVHVGQAVRMHSSNRTSDTGTAFAGVVQSISPELKAGSSAPEYVVAIVPDDDSSLRHGQEFRVTFLQPQRRLLKVMIDRLRAGLSEAWRLNKAHQPGSADPGWLPERLRRAG
jgi:multidrug resistance efflux pump